LECVGLENRIQYRIQNKIAAILKFLKLAMYLFFMWRLDSRIMMGAIPFLRPLKGVALKIATFFVPNGTRFARCHFRARKSRAVDPDPLNPDPLNPDPGLAFLVNLDPDTDPDPGF
jgi:hypothetical protein